MPKQSNNTRNVLFNTGYYLIMDFCNQMGADLLNVVSETTLDTLAVACSSRGVTRVPYFGLATLNSQFDIVWKLAKVKGNFSKISKAFDSLKKIPDSALLNEDDFLSFLYVGINEILTHVDDLSHPSSCDDISDMRINIKIIIITKKDGFSVRFFLKTLLEQLDRQKLLEIQIIEVNDSIHFNSVRDDIIHLVQMRPQRECLEKILKGWLVDLQFDREDLIIEIADHEIKCDINEILLDTSMIPFGNSFHIHKDIRNSSASHLPDPVMPVYRLRVIERISSSGISESSVFGYPIKIQAAQSLKNDQVNLNLQKFNALCKVLCDTDEYIIAKLNNSASPISYFVLMPGDGMFLVKSLASREIMLPSMNSLDNNNNIDLDYEIRLEMSNSIFSLPLLDEYDPSSYKNEICQSLRRQLQTLPSKQNSMTEELDIMQTKSKSFNQKNCKRMSSHRQGKISENKKQRTSYKKDLDVLKYYGKLN